MIAPHRLFARAYQAPTNDKPFNVKCDTVPSLLVIVAWRRMSFGGFLYQCAHVFTKSLLRSMAWNSPSILRVRSTFGSMWKSPGLRINSGESDIALRGFWNIFLEQVPVAPIACSDSRKSGAMKSMM